METVSLTIPDSAGFTNLAQSALMTAQEFAIENAEDYQIADKVRQAAIERVKQGEALFKDATVQANAVHKRLVGLLKAATDPWNRVAQLYKGKMIAWDEEQRRIQRQRQAEEDAKAKAQAEQEQRELAATMRELGLEQHAAEVERETPVVQAPTVPRETEPAIVYRSNWSFEVMCETCKSWVRYGGMAWDLHKTHDLHTDDIPREYMIPDWVKIGKLVRALKGETRIGGIRPVEEKV